LSGGTVRGNRGSGTKPSGTADTSAHALAPDRLLDAHEAAELLHVPVSWVREETRQGHLPHVKLGRYRRYLRADLLEWVEGLKGGSGRRRPRAVA
jgi:excisionase family DNA binding protein